LYRIFFSGKPDLNRKQLSVNKICKMKKSLLTEDHSDIINKGLKETAFKMDYISTVMSIFAWLAL